ncbi:MAG: hypothetical protein PHC91_01385, partial [Eubacteriales bacterium]|nr:hypothetical protein [Eubacteriales bacterium]
AVFFKVGFAIVLMFFMMYPPYFTPVRAYIHDPYPAESSYRLLKNSCAVNRIEQLNRLFS